eukprot:m.18292 g.18292  ORF g.18292 m.18292 type:complete len:402 (-) comp10782_c0_seq1:3-1208(-)
MLVNSAGPAVYSCTGACREDRLLWVVVLSTLGLLQLAVTLTSIALYFNFKHVAGDLVEPLLLRVRDIQDSTSIANTSRQQQLRAMSPLQRQALHYLEHVEASSVNCVTLVKHASFPSLLEFCRQATDNAAKLLAFRALDVLLDVYETHEDLIEQGIAEICCKALLDMPRPSDMLVVLQCLGKLTATEKGCTSLVHASALRQFNALIQREGNASILRETTSVLAALVLVNQYSASQADIGIYVDVCVVVLHQYNTAKEAFSLDALYLLNNLLQYHGYDLSSAQTEQLLECWTPLCQFASAEACVHLARAAFYFLNWKRVTSTFLRLGHVERLAMLMRTAAGTSHAALVASSMLGVLQLLSQVEALQPETRDQTLSLLDHARLFIVDADEHQEALGETLKTRC